MMTYRRSSSIDELLESLLDMPRSVDSLFGDEVMRAVNHVHLLTQSSARESPYSSFREDGTLSPFSVSLGGQDDSLSLPVRSTKDPERALSSLSPPYVTERATPEMNEFLFDSSEAMDCEADLFSLSYFFQPLSSASSFSSSAYTTTESQPSRDREKAAEYSFSRSRESGEEGTTEKAEGLSPSHDPSKQRPHSLLGFSSLPSSACLYSESPISSLLPIKRSESSAFEPAATPSNRPLSSQSSPFIESRESERRHKERKTRGRPDETENFSSRSLPLSSVPSSSSHALTIGGKRKRCTCKKSQCLKLYCECFAAGSYCKGCKCVDCQNTEEFDSKRQEALRAALMRKPSAFLKVQHGSNGEPGPSYGGGCHCKKSMCLKKYCECRQGGLVCGENCKCVDCKNQETPGPKKKL